MDSELGATHPKFEQTQSELEETRCALFKSECSREALQMELSRLRQQYARQQAELRKCLVENEQFKLQTAKNAAMLQEYKATFRQFQAELDRKEAKHKQQLDRLRNAHPADKRDPHHPATKAAPSTVSVKTQTHRHSDHSIGDKERQVLQRQLVHLQMENQELRKESTLLACKLYESQRPKSTNHQSNQTPIFRPEPPCSEPSSDSSSPGQNLPRQIGTPFLNERQDSPQQAQSEQIFSEGRKLQESSIQNVRPKMHLALNLVGNNPFSTVLQQDNEQENSSLRGESQTEGFVLPTTERSYNPSLFGGTVQV
jgi:hypothetical protein